MTAEGSANHSSLLSSTAALVSEPSFILLLFILDMIIPNEFPKSAHGSGRYSDVSSSPRNLQIDIISNPRLHLYHPSLRLT